jgi:hypothetical protein
MRSTNHIAHTAPTSHHLTPLTARTFIIYVFSVQFADARKSNQPHTTSHQTPDLPYAHVDGAQPFRRRASRHDDGRVMLTFKPVSSSLQDTYNPVLV